ncbi:hypothetical protein ABFY54_29530 [Priestia megaterium]|uniref:Uncharacterized protein n=1 Tax=Priestia aryabhattai TaxID=412384 RepID=A0ABD5L2Q3_PRIAR|nr:MULTISPECIES: hypothetical protein [Priestia]MCL9634228.1 hypothetical protein [Bacillus zanthoxyli]KML31475.1 hypothetical protein VL11_02675 [Priestia aryabhattai]KMN93081.1 hypothetical protein ABV89_25935 [Priestia aryabhattai]MCM2978726.1 hypothetical protein [Priestia aryabhattai]MDC7767195.1 hypothetical protein [Priestia aryabhattai]
MKQKFRVYFITYPIVWIVASVLWFWFKNMKENIVSSMAIIAVYYVIMSIMFSFNFKKDNNSNSVGK